MALARVIASGFGAGLSPVAPGTAGSLLGLAGGAALLAWHPAALWVAAGAATLAGFGCVRRARVEGDPGWVVVDEIAGQMVAMVAVPRVTWPWLLAAFGLFRLFDIAKPGPVGWADRQPGAFGIMADDIVAGALAALVLAVARVAT